MTVEQIIMALIASLLSVVAYFVREWIKSANTKFGVIFGRIEKHGVDIAKLQGRVEAGGKEVK